MIVENHATFAVSSTVRTAAQIAELLDLAPTESHEVGDARLRPDGSRVQHPPFEWSWAVWSLDVDDDGSGEDQSGSASLAAVIAPLLTRLERVDELRVDCEFKLSWWGDSDSSQGGFALSQELLAGLARLRCPLFLTAYTSN